MAINGINGLRYVGVGIQKAAERLNMTCKACGDKILDLAACPQAVERRER